MSGRCLMAAIGVVGSFGDQACPVACCSRGRREHGRRPGLDRQSPRQGARSDAAAAVHRRWRKALSKAIRNTFGVAAAIQRCRSTRANIIERPCAICASPTGNLPMSRSRRRSVRWRPGRRKQVNERLLRNQARRLEHERTGRSRAASWRGWRDPHRHPPRPAARTPALARLDQHRRERARHGAPGHPQRQTLEHAEMALDEAAGSLEAKKTFRRLKAMSRPILRNALRGALEERLRPAVPLKPS